LSTAIDLISSPGMTTKEGNRHMSDQDKDSNARPSHITLTFVGEKVAAKARLLWDSAPEICEALVAAAPMRVQSHHGIYSGSEIAAICPQLPQLSQDHASSDVEVGDLAYVYLFAADHHGVAEDFAEICWFYDVDARPSMFTGPAKVSVFARFEDADDFFAASRRMRLEGAKHLEVTTP